MKYKILDLIHSHPQLLKATIRENFSVCWEAPYITSGLKWCSRAQKASPFLQDVVKLVIFTPR